MSWWGWLVAQGLYKDLLATVVAAVAGHLAAYLPLRAHRRRQDKIADLLNTDTPGGLAEVVKAVHPPAPRGKR